MAENAQLRQAEQRIVVEGYLKEIKLRDENDFIRGSVIITTGNQDEHTISVTESKYARDDSKKEHPKAAYLRLQDFMSNAVSMAALMSQGMDAESAMQQAWKISCRGFNARLGRNEYYLPNGEFISREAIFGRGFNQVTSDRFSPRAEFNVECFFDSIRPKLNRDGSTDESGAIVVKAYIPQWGGFRLHLWPMTRLASTSLTIIPRSRRVEFAERLSIQYARLKLHIRDLAQLMSRRQRMYMNLGLTAVILMCIQRGARSRFRLN